MKDYKRRKLELPKVRIPLPKQRCQAFKDQTKYRRMDNKRIEKDPLFCCQSLKNFYITYNRTPNLT